MTANVHELEARRVKVADLAAVLTWAGVSHEDIEALDDATWKLALQVAEARFGRKHQMPSDTTKRQIAEQMKPVPFAGDPFEGIDGPVLASEDAIARLL